jgi:signal transduction histidine kinase/CheY-like chemotaxis protein
MPKRRAVGDVAALRKAAEARVAQTGAATTPSPGELERMVHELRVHQVELELQNEELQLAREAIEASLARYTDLYDAAPVGYLTLGPDGEIRELNLEAARQLGAPRSELVSRRLASLLTTGGAATLRTALGGGQAKSACDVAPACAPDTHLALNAVSDPSRGGHRLVSRDVTEQRRAEAERALLAERLQHAHRLEAIGQLAGGVAHDFNNLLLVIGGATEFLVDLLPGNEPALDEVRSIREATERATTLTRQLLAFGRRQLLRPQAFDLHERVRGVARLLRRVLREDIRVKVEPTEAPIEISADPTQIEQALMNLALNAQDAMPDGGDLTFTVTRIGPDGRTEPHAGDALEPAPTGARARLTVADTGVGMHDAVRARIFEPFFTTKPMGKGVGLGLATVYGIVKQSGGNIACTSSPGRGAVFSIELPCSVDGATRGERAALGRPRTAAPPNAGTILVVEDEPAVREVICRVLAAAGYRTLAARNGEEALVLVRAHRASIALVLTDVVMPRMGGVALRRTLAVERPDLAVILMSGHPEDLVGPGADDATVLSKPFESAALLELISARITAK